MLSARYLSTRAVRRALSLGFLLGGFSLSGLWQRPAQSLHLSSSFSQAAVRQKASEAAQPKEEWMGLYMGPKKIGYTSLRVTPFTFEGKPALRITSQGYVKMQLFGSTVEQETASEAVTDLKYLPLTQTLDVKSNGSALHLEAKYDHAARKVFCRLRTGETPTEKTLTIPKGANLVGDMNYLTEGQKLAVGQKFSVYYLNPIAIELEEAKIEVTGRETLKDSAGKLVPVFVSKSSMPLGQGISWDTEDGETLKAQQTIGPVSLMLYKEPKETALNMQTVAPEEKGNKTYVPPADFALATAITTDKPILQERSARSLTLTIGGVPEEKYVLSDARQKAEIVPVANALAGLTVRYTIQAAPFEAARSLQLPVTDSALTPYLKKVAYLDTSDINIRSTAERLRGQDRNLYRIAVRIRDWVHKVMTPDPSIGVPRSASDIFLKRRGVCRDYATLYAALARAAGVPTKLCGGIVYGYGKFFYHAWAESYVGQWVPFDPTLYDPKQSADFVDATHIKFAEGDVISMFNTVAVIGKLRIAIQEVSQ